MSASHPDGYDFRRFAPEIEAQAAKWSQMAMDTGDWRPSSPPGRHETPRPLGHGSWVTDGQSYCYVKQRARGSQFDRDEPEGLAKEQIMADIGFDLGVSVAPGRLWTPKGRDLEKPWYLSMLPFPKTTGDVYLSFVERTKPPADPAHDSRDRTLAEAAHERSLLTQVASQNTALWVLHRWTGDHSEHHSSENMQMNADPVRGLCIAAHDHAYARMKFDDYQPLISPDPGLWPFAGRNAYLTDKPPDRAGRIGGIVTGNWKPPIDTAAGRAMLARIEAYPVARIEEIVNRTPASLVSDGMKQNFVEGLLESREKTAAWMNRRLDEYDRQHPKLTQAPSSSPAPVLKLR